MRDLSSCRWSVAVNTTGQTYFPAGEHYSTTRPWQRYWWPRHGWVCSQRLGGRPIFGGRPRSSIPGLILVGIGADFDVLPQLRIVSNLSYLRFETTRVIEALRQEKGIDEEIGWDLSAGLIYRPLMTNNIALQASGAVLFPGNGLQDLYKEDAGDPLYSVLLSATFQY